MTRPGKDKKANRLFLLDAYALIFRAYYAFIRNPRYNSKGLNTSAIFGFANTLDDLLQNEKPSHIAVVFDPPYPTFRHEMYTAYKANREETPEDIKRSIPYIKELISAFNIPVIEVMGYEADDVIGTLARKAEKQGFTVYMVTPDKDFAQLVTDQVFMYKPRKGGNDAEIWGIEEVKTNFHVEHPEQVIDILALMGDTADNIPGAPGVGEVTSKKLIGAYGTINELFDHAGELKGKLRENIENNRDQIRLSKQLATIALDVPVEFRENDLKITTPDMDHLKELFNELEFKTIAKRIFDRKPPEMEQHTAKEPQQANLFEETKTTIHPITTNFETIHTIQHDYLLADSEETIRHLARQLDKLPEFCFDTETTGLDIRRAELVGVSFSWSDHRAWYIPLPEHTQQAIALLAQVKPVFENPHIRKAGQNLKFDIQMLRRYGIAVQGELFDTMLAHYLMRPERRHNLDYLAETWLNYSPVPIEELIGEKGKNQTNLRSVPLERVRDYACEDADITWQLKGILEKELKTDGLDELARKIEMPLIYVLADMEEAGVKLDKEVLENYTLILRAEIAELESAIYRFAGTEFNISSPKQLGEILFDRLKIITNARKTKTRQYATSEEVLTSLSDKHPLIPKVLEHRSLKKLLSTYVEVLPGLVNHETNKIHTSFNQAVTATGRLSSNNPNLQNIPIREEKGREIRKAFIPSSPDHLLFSADYSQIELRLMAHMSGDPDMIGAFLEGRDIHQATAAKIHGISLLQVTPEMRNRAKTANFGIIYGISAFGLAQRLKIARSEASSLITGYFKSYPKVQEYMMHSIQRARDTGYAETIMGRRRHLPDLLSRNSVVRGMAERNAINAPIQGSAADIIKLAMVNIRHKMKEMNCRSEMILQVHDELIFDVHMDEFEEVKTLVLEEMQNAVSLTVPLTVDWGKGQNWLEAH